MNEHPKCNCRARDKQDCADLIRLHFQPAAWKLEYLETYEAGLKKIPVCPYQCHEQNQAD